MPLKLKVMLGPIAKYKQFGIPTLIMISLFRSIPLETIDMCDPYNPYFRTSDADDRGHILLQTIGWGSLL